MSYWYWRTKVNSFIKRIWNKEVVIKSKRSSWPWWQNMQKNETALQLLRKVWDSIIFPEEQKTNLYVKAKHYLTNDSSIRIDAHVHRTQKANKDLLFKKLEQLIKSVFKEEPSRKKTSKPQRAEERRLAQKRKRSKKLKTRRWLWNID